MNGQRPLGETRSGGTVVLLTIVTCGIYHLIQVYKVGNEIKNYLNKEEVNPTLYTILALLCCVFGVAFVYYKYAKFLVEMQQVAGLPENDISLLAAILWFIPLGGIFAIIKLQNELNTIWAASGKSV